MKPLKESSANMYLYYMYIYIHSELLFLSSFQEALIFKTGLKIKKEMKRLK